MLKTKLRGGMDTMGIELIEKNKSLYNIIINDFKHVIETRNQSFYLVYQPQVNVITGEVETVEALARWNHSNFGEILPTYFIRLAERLGLIEAVGDLVLEEACYQLKKWHLSGYSKLKIAINLSPIQLRNDRALRKIEELIYELCLSPSQIELELTESVFIGVDLRVLDMIHKFKKLGISLAIDDFGTGYSSLKYLCDLPIDRLKIDKCFIDNDNEKINIILETIIALVKRLDIIPVAEGVETMEQQKYLIDKGCFITQGYFYSRPILPHQLDYTIKVIKEKLKFQSYPTN